MLKKKLSGIMIFLVGVMLVFTIINCNSGKPDDDPDDKTNNNPNNKPDGGVGVITSLSVKTKGLKSLYLGNVAARAGVNSSMRAVENGSISTLSYIDESGNNAPVVFVSPSNKQYMLEIKGMDKIDSSRIIIMYSGIYEVTAGEENIVGEKQDKSGGALIDMSSGRVYEFQDVWMTKISGVDIFCHSLFFIEDNICYLSSGYPNTTF